MLSIIKFHNKCSLDVSNYSHFSCHIFILQIHFVSYFSHLFQCFKNRCMKATNKNSVWCIPLKILYCYENLALLWNNFRDLEYKPWCWEEYIGIHLQHPPFLIFYLEFWNISNDITTQKTLSLIINKNSVSNTDCTLWPSL